MFLEGGTVSGSYSVATMNNQKPENRRQYGYSQLKRTSTKWDLSDHAHISGNSSPNSLTLRNRWPNSWRSELLNWLRSRCQIPVPKETLCRAWIFAYPQPGEKFVVDTDKSNIGVRVPSQVHGERSAQYPTRVGWTKERETTVSLGGNY
jgi:hypothetical protein